MNTIRSYINIVNEVKIPPGVSIPSAEKVHSAFNSVFNNPPIKPTPPKTSTSTPASKSVVPYKPKPVAIIPPATVQRNITQLFKNPSWKKILISAGILGGIAGTGQLLDKEKSTEPSTPTKPPEPAKSNEPVKAASVPPSTPGEPGPKVNLEVQLLANQAKREIQNALNNPSIARDARVRNAMEQLDLFLADVPDLNWQSPLRGRY